MPSDTALVQSCSFRILAPDWSVRIRSLASRSRARSGRYRAIGAVEARELGRSRPRDGSGRPRAGRVAARTVLRAYGYRPGATASVGLSVRSPPGCMIGYARSMRNLMLTTWCRYGAHRKCRNRCAGCPCHSAKKGIRLRPGILETSGEEYAPFRPPVCGLDINRGARMGRDEPHPTLAGRLASPPDLGPNGVCRNMGYGLYPPRYHPPSAASCSWTSICGALAIGNGRAQSLQETGEVIQEATVLHPDGEVVNLGGGDTAGWPVAGFIVRWLAGIPPGSHHDACVFGSHRSEATGRTVISFRRDRVRDTGPESAKAWCAWPSLSSGGFFWYATTHRLRDAGIPVLWSVGALPRRPLRKAPRRIPALVAK